MCSGDDVGRGSVAVTCCLIEERADDGLVQYVIMSCSQSDVEGGGECGGCTLTEGGAANSTSNGDRFILSRLLILMYISTRGRAFVHGRPVSLQDFANFAFSVPFSLSMAPPLAG